MALPKTWSSEEAIAVFMAEAFKTNDAAGYVAHSLRVEARVRGMKQIAEQTRLSRKQPYRLFSEQGNRPQ